MNKKMKPYKGYTATIEFDPDEMVLHGRVDHIRDVVTFHASSVAEVEREFAAAVDDYLELCSERNEEPERPYSGRFVLRIDPDLHRRIASVAGRNGTSINSWIVHALRASLDAESASQEREEALVERFASTVRSLMTEQEHAPKRGVARENTYLIRESSRATAPSDSTFHEQLRKLGHLNWAEQPDQPRSRKEELQ